MIKCRSFKKTKKKIKRSLSCHLFNILLEFLINAERQVKKKMFVFLDPTHTPPIRECYKHLLPLQQDSSAACVYLLQFLSIPSEMHCNKNSGPTALKP